jgi:hypothetical protein
LPHAETSRLVDLGLLPPWMEVGTRFPIALAGFRVWSGRIQLPVARGARPQRLDAWELETYDTDAEAVGSRNLEPHRYDAQRVVYVDIVELFRRTHDADAA